ncbi:protein-S-isoprenylcysteine O-methyltransferase [Copidosoma floridanum]|uniref:protein-S-isoprenylcysteine O-methyltransferase n=1 Tax=Copidosoma floridanum TaxID=29053 RepID=UPI0006C99E67|nr:protein-S-isoprenylcysteine O-methyltransferase [Copidosoma floridanum]
MSLSLYSISARAFFLGFVICLGLSIDLASEPTWKIFGVYASVLSTFHFTEFLSVASTNPVASSSDTYIINHSFAYTVAALASWIEYFFERYYFPIIKQNLWISLVGIIMCATGEIIRKTAIYTAQHNFNHIVQNTKSNNHSLVTHGIYNICRHPSYVGWFYWSIGTQLILQNPLCLTTYTIISWRFFKERITIEESSLLKFFGSSYIVYQSKVGTGLPFIFGHKRNIP